MLAKLDLKAVLAMSQARRKMLLSISEAKRLGLKVVDAVGGAIMWVGTAEEYSLFIATGPLSMPGARSR